MEMLLVATLVLVAGLIDDLRSRKVHNSLIVVLFAIVVAANAYFRGLEGSLAGIGAIFCALLIGVPLFMFHVWGGGDVKLFAVFSLATDPIMMFSTLIYSLIWGGLFGLTRAYLQKELLALVKNTCKIALRQRVEIQEIQKIPYTFALLLGWLTQLTLMRAGGAL